MNDVWAAGERASEAYVGEAYVGEAYVGEVYGELHRQAYIGAAGVFSTC